MTSTHEQEQIQDGLAEQYRKKACTTLLPIEGGFLHVEWSPLVVVYVSFMPLLVVPVVVLLVHLRILHLLLLHLGIVDTLILSHSYYFLPL